MQTANAQVRTWRVRNHHVPAITEHVSHVALVVRPSRLGGQQVARHCIMASGDKGVADDSRKFTGYEYAHHIPLLAHAHAARQSVAKITSVA
jgi:hypothetical protein